jgi:hypothetical protein
VSLDVNLERMFDTLSLWGAGSASTPPRFSSSLCSLVCRGRDDPRVTVEQPGEGNLCRGPTFSSPGDRVAEIASPEGGVGVNLAGEETFPEGLKGRIRYPAPRGWAGSPSLAPATTGSIRLECGHGLNLVSPTVVCTPASESSKCFTLPPT